MLPELKLDTWYKPHALALADTTGWLGGGWLFWKVGLGCVGWCNLFKYFQSWICSLKLQYRPTIQLTDRPVRRTNLSIIFLRTKLNTTVERFIRSRWTEPRVLYSSTKSFQRIPLSFFINVLGFFDNRIRINIIYYQNKSCLTWELTQLVIICKAGAG